MSEIKQIEPQNWENFLEDFSARNHDRRARIDVYRNDGNVEEESTEAHFENASLETNDGATAVVNRVDRSKTDADKMRDAIDDVIGIAVQYDTDGSEDALRITNRENELISLRFESKVDGAS